MLTSDSCIKNRPHLQRAGGSLGAAGYFTQTPHHKFSRPARSATDPVNSALILEKALLSKATRPKNAGREGFFVAGISDYGILQKNRCNVKLSS